MKYLSILIVFFFMTSCGSRKNTIKTRTNQPKEALEIPKTPKPPSPPITVEKTNSMQSSDTIKIIEKGDVKKITKIQKNKLNDTVQIHQKVTKREGSIHSLFDKLLKKYVSNNGKVDYSAFKNSHKTLLGYISVLQQIYLKQDSVSLSREDKLAYWINTYNALTIDLILRNYPLKSIKDIKDPWSQRLWKFGNKWMNLNDIEHKILRKMNEPRIHFAIVCASESCPKLLNEAFTASNLDAQLTDATKAFLLDTSKNEISENNLKLSKIFKWFAKDFKTEGSLITFLNQYTEIHISKNAKKSFKDYNWDLNE